jgi:acetyltransferase-like isoleucine patch superfamily enzyme
MPGVTIGENSTIGAFSFVNSDIPANAIAFGIPAKISRKVRSRKKS